MSSEKNPTFRFLSNSKTIRSHSSWRIPQEKLRSFRTHTGNPCVLIGILEKSGSPNPEDAAKEEEKRSLESQKHSSQ